MRSEFASGGFRREVPPMYISNVSEDSLGVLENLAHEIEEFVEMRSVM